MLKRYCGMCDDVTNHKECPACGEDTDKLPHPVRGKHDLYDDPEVYNAAIAKAEVR